MTLHDLILTRRRGERLYMAFSVSSPVTGQRMILMLCF